MSSLDWICIIIGVLIVSGFLAFFPCASYVGDSDTSDKDVLKLWIFTTIVFWICIVSMFYFFESTKKEYQLYEGTRVEESEVSLKSIKIKTKGEGNLKVDSSSIGIVHNNSVNFDFGEDAYLEFFTVSGGKIQSNEVLLKNIRIEVTDKDSVHMGYRTYISGSAECEVSLTREECAKRFEEEKNKYKFFVYGADVINATEKRESSYVLYIPDGFDMTKLYDGVSIK